MDWRGKPVSDGMLSDLSSRVEKLKKKGILPKLAVLRVGERPEDLAYERGIVKRFSAANAEVEVSAFPEDVSQKTLEEAVEAWNARNDVHGILVFRPLPKHLNEEKLFRILSPEKDVDCMTPENALHVYYGDGKGFFPCTPQAVIEMIDAYGYDVCGKNIAVVGRSKVVGKPLAMMLIARHATVTVCHTRTKNLEEICRRADMIVACAGSARMIGPAHVRPETVLIDVGINADGDGICGDADYERISGIVSVITPVPGGVGSVTTSVLLKHVVESAERSAD